MTMINAMEEVKIECGSIMALIKASARTAFMKVCDVRFLTDVSCYIHTPTHSSRRNGHFFGTDVMPH